MIPLQLQQDFVLRELTKLGHALGLAGLSSYVEEVVPDQGLKSAIESKVADVESFHTKRWDSILRLGLYRIALYALVRALKPTVIVETGVLHGLATIFPLSALEANGKSGDRGRMISIDAPSTFEEGPSNNDGFHDTLPPGLGPGWAIPDELRSLWDLRIGTSRQCLPGALAECGQIEFFIHDSEHTEETMLFEFEAAWPALAAGGVLLADNVDVNTSFFDFARSKGRIVHVLPVEPDHRVPGGSGIRCALLRK